jgi:aminopeptidase N
VFFSILHTYATDTSFMFRNAVTEDFAAIASQVSGQDLSWFFNEWVYQPNHPAYENYYGIDDLGNSQWKVLLSVEQTQTNTVFFQMPIEVEIDFLDGSDTLITIFNDVNPQLFEFTFTKAPSLVLFDPFRNILLKQSNTTLGLKGKKGKTGLILDQNVPNPFQHLTNITYTVPSHSNVRITVLDTFGKILATPVNAILLPGNYELSFESRNLAPGVYFYQMECDGVSQVKRMVITR